MQIIEALYGFPNYRIQKTDTGTSFIVP